MSALPPVKVEEEGKEGEEERQGVLAFGDPSDGLNAEGMESPEEGEEEGEGG
jgi:hypothetical protein